MIKRLPMPSLPSPFFRLWTSEISRVVGGQTIQIVTPWILLIFFPNAKSFGFIMMLWSLPRILGIVLSGWLTSKYHPTLLLKLSSLVSGIFALLIAAAMFYTFHEQIILVLALALFLTFSEGIYFPSISVSVAHLFEKPYWGDVNAILQGTNQVGKIVISMVLGTVLILIGHQWTFLAAGIFFLGSYFMVPNKNSSAKDGATRQDSNSTQQSSWALLKNPLFVLLCVMSIGINFGFIGPSGAAIPLFVNKTLHLSSSTYSMIIGFESGGSLLGAFLAMKVKPKRALLIKVFLILLMGATCWSMIGPFPYLWVLICASFLSMTAFTWVNILSISLIQLWFEGPLLSKVMSLLWLLTTVLGPISYAMTGIAFRWISIPYVFDAGSMFIAFTVVLAWLTTRSRKLRIYIDTTSQSLQK